LGSSVKSKVTKKKKTTWKPSQANVVKEGNYHDEEKIGEKAQRAVTKTRKNAKGTSQFTSRRGVMQVSYAIRIG